MKHSLSVFRRASSLVARIPFIGSCAAWHALAFVFAGFVIARESAHRLWELWLAVSPHLPFSLPPDVADRIQWSAPVILNGFVCAVSSFAGCLIGVMWVFMGIGDAFATLGKEPQPGPTADPGLVADRLIMGRGTYWAAPSLILRLLGKMIPPFGRLTPARYTVGEAIVGSFWKLILIWLLIAALERLLPMAPHVAKTYLRTEFTLVVPSMSPLYTLLALAFAIETVMVVSLVPFWAPSMERTSESFRVRGWGEPSLMLALIEEGCRLLNAGGSSGPHALRLCRADARETTATFIESAPTPLRRLGAPVAYICAPLAFFLLTVGFSRLIHFHWPDAPIHYAQFISRHLVNCLLSVASALLLIYCGLRFSRVGRLLGAMGRYKSAAVFCRVQLLRNADDAPDWGFEDVLGGWSVSRTASDSFVEWAKNPTRKTAFDVSVYWTELVTESAGPEEPRSPAGSSRSEELDRAVHRILELPALVAFRYEAAEAKEAAGIGSEMGARS